MEDLVNAAHDDVEEILRNLRQPDHPHLLVGVSIGDVLDAMTERTRGSQIVARGIGMIVVDGEHVLPRSGRKSAEPANVSVPRQGFDAGLLPQTEGPLGTLCRGVDRGNEWQEHLVYWNVICAAAPVLDTAPPETVLEANEPHRLAERKAPPRMTPAIP